MENQIRRIVREVIEEVLSEAKNITPKGKKVSRKYLTKDPIAMKKEIDKHAKKTDDDPSAYVKWIADYKKRDTKKGEPYETRKSKATKAFEKMFGEEEVIEESNYKKALRNKSEITGIPYSILKQVYNRGLAAWKTGHRPGASQHQWAMGRVNSFATGVGKARDADSDLWDKMKD